MSGIEFEDKSGSLPSSRDAQSALSAIEGHLGPQWLMKLPPGLAVELPNIRRIVLTYAALAEAREAQSG